MYYGIKQVLEGMGGFNSDDHYIYCCGQESFGRNGVALIVNKRLWNAVLGCNLFITGRIGNSRCRAALSRY